MAHGPWECQIKRRLAFGERGAACYSHMQWSRGTQRSRGLDSRLPEASHARLPLHESRLAGAGVGGFHGHARDFHGGRVLLRNVGLSYIE
ncbi:hypothetical protein E2562_032232 [Oryza meyeriana var. granulata]|uniref:Uncharacterized protein n=1 Tax=Oryza meyeriana var. granulata TaxID=110450 RepID=A0A6G1DAL6_9ORYZ|nr:hypothetical protein E2562_032232 [Oryza meyeriana var. granulata]